MSSRVPAKLAKVSVSLPFGLGSAEWTSDPTERKAAWSLYVELATRISLQPLEAELEQGLLREALLSLHSLFKTTRDVLKEAGPSVGIAPYSVGGIALAVLNRGLRPFLSKWHPLLQAWETQRPPHVNPVAHENNWCEEPQLRNELELLRQELEQYASVLAALAGVEE